MNWLRAIKMLLALKCNESTRIISDGVERELTPLSPVKCDNCLATP